jgi:twitching motility protein PilT
MAALVHQINETQHRHIVTLESPIEFLHRDINSSVTQREIGVDTRGFHEALRSVLRQDPDFVLVGELRDQETVEAALTLAETGHLTFGTLHTSDCVQTVNRVIDVFPAHQQAQIRAQLSFTLEAVFCQQLMPHSSGKGRVLAAEVMLANSAVRALIRDGKGHQVYSQIQTGGRMGMRTMSQSLSELVKANKVSVAVAERALADPNELRALLRGVA